MNGDKRYRVCNIAWRRLGERSGLLRRRRWMQRTQLVGEADALEVAAQILVTAPMYADEMVVVYDHGNHGFCCARKYGWAWK